MSGVEVIQQLREDALAIIEACDRILPLLQRTKALSVTMAESSPRATAQKRAYKKQPKPTTKSVDASEQPDSGTLDVIRALLARRPMTSADVIKASGKTASAAYTALSTLRKRGEVETITDDSDGQKKNRLVAV